MPRGASSRELPPGQRKLLITDGVFSMDGDLGAARPVRSRRGIRLHHDGGRRARQRVFGQNGQGTVDHFGMHGRVDVQVGTLSKAIGALGGYVAGSRTLIEFLHHRARPFLFSTSHPPAVAAACLAALDVLIEEPQLVDRLWATRASSRPGSRIWGSTPGSARARSR